MKSSKKLIALICSLAMIFSVFANLTIVNADTTAVDKGMNLTLDTAASTELEKVVNVSYAGMPNGVASFELDVNVPEGATVKSTSSIFTGMIDNLADGVYKVGGTSADNVKSDDAVFLTLTITLANPLTEDYVVTLQNGTNVADEDGVGVDLEAGSMPATSVVLSAPKATEAPATPIPDAPAVDKGMNLTLDTAASTELEKVVNVSYAGMPNGVASFELDINVPEGATVKSTSSIFTGMIDNLADGVYKVGGTSADNVKSDDAVFLTLTITLANPLTEDYVVTLQNGTNIADEDGVGVDLEAGSMPSTYVVLRAPAAPTTAPTEEPTTAPTEEPKTVLGSIAFNELFDADDAVDGSYITMDVKTKDGKDAVYGTDYVVVDKDGNVLSEADFKNTIWGYNESVSVKDAINGFKLNSYVNDLEVNAKLNANGLVVDTNSATVAPSATTAPSATPTAAPDPNGVQFASWSAGSFSGLTKNDTKSVKATFNKIPAAAKNISIDFEASSNAPFTVTSSNLTTSGSDTQSATAVATVKVNKSKTATSTITAILTYTLDGKTYTVSSTDFTVKTKTNSSSGSGSSGSSIGGIIGTVTPTPAPNVPFTDLDQAPWAETAITYLYNNGLVNGRSATEFAPQGEITRAEFAKLILAAYGVTIAEGVQTSAYSDVVSGEWYTPYVLTAAQYGLVKGYDDGTFRPNALVSRQEMAVMMYRAATTFGTQLPAKNEAKTWTDNTIADWAAEAVNALQVAGIINGYEDGRFGGTDASTRAQAAQMIYNLYIIK